VRKVQPAYKARRALREFKAQSGLHIWSALAAISSRKAWELR